MLVSDWAQKYFCAQSEASFYRAELVFFLYEVVYLQTTTFGALSIQPKIPEISGGTSNGTGHFGPF